MIVTIRALMIFLALAVLVLDAYAQKPPVRTGLEIGVGDEADPSVYQGMQRINARTGAPEALYYVGFTADPATPEAMARQYLAANAAALRLNDPTLNDLTHLRTQRSPVGYVVRFQQHVGDVPVLGGRIAVTINHDHVVTFVANEYKPDIDLAGATAAVSTDQARQGVVGHLQPRGPLHVDETTLVVYYDRGTSRLAYRSRIVPGEAPIGDWEVLTDAVTGALLRVRDRAIYHRHGGEDEPKEKAAGPVPKPLVVAVPVNGSGLVFDPDPLSSAGAQYGDPGFVDGGDADTPQLNGERVNVTLESIDLSGGLHHLDGPRTHIVDMEAPFKGLFSQVSSAFNFTRQQDGFEAVNTYHHVDHYMKYLNETLGLGIFPTLNSGEVIFDPHGLNGDDNSHYISSTELIAFGEGGVDDAEDADVIIHELGHGLHDWAAGCISQSNGLSEGIGDYTAAEYSQTLGQWTPADPEYNWVFNWDGHNPFWPGRVTNWNDTNTWPAGTGGGCLHTCGQYWSSSMIDIWELLGRDATARAHWTGVMSLGCSATHVDAANAMLQAAADLGYPSADINTMFDVFVNNTGYPATLPPGGAAFTLNLKRVFRTGSGLKKAVIKWQSGDVSTNKIDFYVDETPDGTPLKRTRNDNKVKLKLPTAQFPGDGPFAIQACEKKSTTVCSDVVMADFTGAVVDLNEPDEDDVTDDAAAKAGGETVPEVFALQGNYPNPFNPVTQIRMDLPERAEVRVTVYDLLGRQVLALPAQVLEAGAARHIAVDGSSLASGTYLYRLTARAENTLHVATGRMVLVK